MVLIQYNGELMWESLGTRCSNSMGPKEGGKERAKEGAHDFNGEKKSV